MTTFDDILRDIDDEERSALERVRELESSKLEAQSHGSDISSIETELESTREILQQIKFQRLLVHGETHAIFPPDALKRILNEEREKNRYWMEEKKPREVPATFDRTTKPVFRKRLEHSVTSDYESDKWAVLNILLETLQNAEPNDSNGTWFGIEIFVRGGWKVWRPFTFSKKEGAWVPSKEMDKFRNDEIEAVRIIDNGSGFVPTELAIFGSSKDPNSDAGGRFGEGGNMADVTACRLGIEVIKSSRNWQAKAGLMKQQATGRTVERLAYDVEFHDDVRPGTCVEFRKFGPDFGEALRSVHEHYLPLRGPEYRAVSHTHYGDIVETKDTNIIFIKGRAYPVVPEPDKPFLFSYNLTRFVVQDRNRSRINLYDAIGDIRRMWGHNRNRQAVKDLITAHKNGHPCFELQQLGKHTEYESWDDEVLDLFGEVACEVYEIPDPKKCFSTMGKGYEEAEKFLRENGGWSALTIGGSKFLTHILQQRFKSTEAIFNGPEVPGALACAAHGDILQKGTDIFSNGKVVKVSPATSHPPLFSYNLKEFTYKGANSVSKDILSDTIVRIWKAIGSEALIKELFETYKAKQQHYEHECMPSGHLGKDFPSAPIFIKVACEIFGVKDPKKCFLKHSDTGSGESEGTLKEKGYSEINVQQSCFLFMFLHSAGIPTAEEILDRTTVRKAVDVPPRTAAKRLNENTLLMGLWQFVSNRAREKNSAGICEIEVLTLKVEKDGTRIETWVPYQQWISGGSDGQMIAFRFKGNMAAINQNDLDFEPREKRKPPCLHALCSYMILHSIPFTIKSGNSLIRLESKYGDHTYKIQDLGENGSNGTTTITIFEPLEHIREAFRGMKKRVLDLDPDYKPLEKTPYGDLIETDGGEIYRFGILDETAGFTDPDDSKERHSYYGSYSVRDYDPQTPSRILEHLSKVEIIQKVLRAASQGKKCSDLEGIARLQNPEAWKKAFFAEFGEKTIVIDGQSMLGTAVAERFEYEKITLPKSLTKILVEEAGVPSLSGLASVGEYKEEKGLSENTQSLVDFGANIRSWLQEKLELMGVKAGENLIAWDSAKVKVVSKLKNKNGDDLKEFGGFFDSASGNIFIFADRLAELSKGLQAMIRVMNYSLGDVFKDHVQASLYMDNVFSTLMECLVKSGLVKDLLGEPLESLEHENLDVGLTSLFGEMTEEVKKEREKRQMLLRNRIKKAFLIKRKQLAEGMKKFGAWQSEQKKKFAEAMQKWREARERRKLEKREEREPWRFSMPNIDAIRGATRTMAILLIVGGAGTLAYNRINFDDVDLPDIGLSSFDLPSFDFPDLPDFFGESAPEPPPEKSAELVYRRPEYPTTYQPTVVARRVAGGITPEMNNPKWLEAVFLSSPNYNQWEGFWMTDSRYEQFNGTNWTHDTNAKDFPHQSFENQIEWMHIQSASSPGEVFLRTQSAGEIIPESIRVLDKDKNPLPFRSLPQGEGMLLSIPDAGADQVVYVTRRPFDWHGRAHKVRDKDYESLPRETFEYYTATPNIDLSKIPFSFWRIPQAKNWKTFFDILKQQTPRERFSYLHEYIQSRPYSDDPEVAAAYRDFKKGKTPEKSLIEFLLKSPALPKVATGDCDVHNTLFAWALREAGIPSRLDIVMNGEHGIANAFFPGVGWVIGDAVGQTRLHRSQSTPNIPERTFEKTYEQRMRRLSAEQRYNEKVNSCVLKADGEE